ncbi:MAG: N-acetylmuramoyl-L-alanine amidase [Acidobacteriaceae bacterium]|nr:N-acetylmuramoyl-L-alanine amidase [Acidobacteriaceae bacterium]
MLSTSVRIAQPLLVALLFGPAPFSFAQSGPAARVQAIRFWSFGDVTRVAIETEGDYKLFSDQVDKPPRIYFDLTGLRPPATAHHGSQTIEIKDRLVKEIRVAEVLPGKTRVVFDLEAPVDVVSSQLVNPDRLMIEVRPKSQLKPTVSLSRSTTGSKKIDLTASTLDSVSGESSAAGTPIVVVSNSGSKAPDVKQTEPSGEQVTQSTTPLVPASVSAGTATARAPVSVIDAPSLSNSNIADTSPSTALVASHEAAPPPLSTSKVRGDIAPAKRDSTGDRSLVRVLGLKLGRVVIDPGHGGHDTGTIGPNGLLEKDLVLDVALRLGKLITQQLGAEVVYTRSGDVFIPLEQRTKIANNERADLFISIHANSSPEPSATGVETFFFNLNADRVSLDLATRENATSLSSISDLNDLLHKAVLENKLEESREFAQQIQSALWTTSLKINSRSRDRGVRQAPFVVLIGASMPSILAEIGFVSNPHDERLLKRADQRQKIAEALLKGISRYASTLSHVQVARAHTVTH